MEKAITHGLSLGLKFGALTNGTIISEKVMNLIQGHFSYIRVSVDTFDYKRYIKKRRPHDHNQFRLMIANLIKLGTQRKSNNLMVGVKLLLTKDNCSDIFLDIEKAMELCGAWNLDSLQIKVAEQEGDQINDVFTLSEQINNFVDEHRDRYKFPILAGTSKSKIKERCWLNPVQLTVDPLGDVYLCCYFQHRQESHKLCNIFTDDLQAFWGSEYHKEKIGQIKIKECNVWNCRFHGYHKIANAIVSDSLQLQFC